MTQQFLNTELKPYNSLTREEKHILFDAHLDGNVECHYDKPEWYPLYKSDGFNDFTVYRTKPKEYKKLEIAWQVVADNWKYAAMDKNGDLYLFENIPEWNKTYWTETSSYGRATEITKVLTIDTTGIVAEHSLTQRPEGV